MRARVGIPPSLDATGRIRAGRRYDYLDAAYARAVAEAGGVPLYLPGTAPVDAALDAVDALLVPGGDDLLPRVPYPAHVRFAPVPEPQRAFDEALLRGALARGLPVLGVCYGMQLLVHTLGGALLYDLAHERPELAPHRLAEPEGRHGLRLAPGSRLAEILGGAGCEVNSLHHQGVADPGPALRASAWADDGLVEAVEWPDRTRFVVGVQWHPEKLETSHRAQVFGALVGAGTRARSAARPGPVALRLRPETR
jgi:putative glutamine amidotransferase